jgi:hypothetical protein
MIEAQQRILDAGPDFRPVATVHDQALNLARHLLRQRLAREQPVAGADEPDTVPAAAG